MFICLGILVSENYIKKQYRIYDSKSGKTVDIDKHKLTKEVIGNVRNITFISGEIAFCEGREKDYPLYDIDKKMLYNNVPIVFDIRNVKGHRECDILNFEGKKVTIDENSLILRINRFANVKIGKLGYLEYDLPETRMNVDYYNALLRYNDTEKFEFNESAFRPLADTIGDSASDTDFVSMSDSINEFIKVGKYSVGYYTFDIRHVEDRVELVKCTVLNKDKNLVIVIPDNVTHIMKEAFLFACAKEAIIPDSVYYLEDGAFRSSYIDKIHISKNITVIPAHCFYYSYIKEINLENIQSIGNYSFEYSKIEYAHLGPGVIQVGISAFEGCTRLKEFTHSSIKKIRKKAFANTSISEFNFSTVEVLEASAFYNTDLSEVELNGEIGYLQTNTITGKKIKKVVIKDGMEKLGGHCVYNHKAHEIEWHVPKSVRNIDNNVFTTSDTVYCYRNSIAATQALISKANVVYLDEEKKADKPSLSAKAAVFGTTPDELLKDTLKRIISKDSITEYDKENFKFNSNRVASENIPSSILDLLPERMVYREYANEEDIENETIKFRAILRHLYMVGKFDITPFSSLAVNLKPTYTVYFNKTKDILYDDGKSMVVRLYYYDNKFSSNYESFIVAKTKDTLRYICMDNKYTNFMCEISETFYNRNIFKMLSVGDTIGLVSVIDGRVYPEISLQSDKTIKVTRRGRVREEKIRMNLYQALKYSAISFRLAGNSIALMFPADNKIMLCTSLGRTVWLNETEETYKSLQCTVSKLEDIDNNTIFDYDSTYGSKSYRGLFDTFLKLKGNCDNYVKGYKYINPAERSMYKLAGEYAHAKGMKKIEDIDITFVNMLSATPLIEYREPNWLSGSIGKTIVPDINDEYTISDGFIIRQYVNSKRIALKNDLMVAGDRRVYIFEIITNTGRRDACYISTLDIKTIVNMCFKSCNDNISKGKIFTNSNYNYFDAVQEEDCVVISAGIGGRKLKYGGVSATVDLVMYIPNGIYYLGITLDYESHKKIVPFMQIGSLDSISDFISNNTDFTSTALNSLFSICHTILVSNVFLNNNKAMDSHNYLNANDLHIYNAYIEARKHCIDGVCDIESYKKLDSSLRYCLGYNLNIDSYYKTKTLKEIIEELKGYNRSSVYSIDDTEEDDDYNFTLNEDKEEDTSDISDDDFYIEDEETDNSENSEESGEYGFDLDEEDEEDEDIYDEYSDILDSIKDSSDMM